MCPYPGLAPFGEQDARWFHGRAHAVEAVCARLEARTGTATGPLVVIGPSGSGKSSLLAAGVLPALAAGRLARTGSRDWAHATLTPTASPALALAAAAGLDPEEARSAAADWLGDAERCAREFTARAGSTGPTAPGGLVVVVDQLEELFTLGADYPERQWFIDVLDLLSRPAAGRPRVLVLLAVRADFFSACTDHRQLRTALRADPVLLDPMTTDELAEAIRRPAADVGLAVEDGLVDVILAELDGAAAPRDPNSTWNTAARTSRLPLLAHALWATWFARDGDVLTIGGYRRTGGITGAIRDTADAHYLGLSPKARDIARLVFRQLVIVRMDADDARRRMRYQDLLDVLPDPEAGAEVIELFTNARLLTQDQDHVVLTHEALMRAWPTLRQWIEDDRAGALVRQDLEESAAAWAREGRERAALLRGTRLEAADTWSTAHPNELSPGALAYLNTARRQERRARTLRHAAVAVITALAVLASTAAVVAIRQDAGARAAAARALSERNRAVEAQLAAETLQYAATDTAQSSRLALTAYRLFPTAQSASRLLSTQNTPTSTRARAPGARDSVKTVAYSPDGRTMAAGNLTEPTVRLWDVTDPGRAVQLGEPLPEDPGVDSIRSVAFSPDGRTLAVGGHSGDHTRDGITGEGVLDLWDVSNAAHPHALGTVQQLPWGAVESVAFSPDGRVLAAADSGGQVRLWNLTGPGRPEPIGTPLSGPEHPVRSVAFGPDGRVLAAADSGGQVRLWNVADPGRPAPVGVPLAGPESAATTVAFSPDGRTLAIGGTDAAVRLWDVTEPGRAAQIGAPLTGPANAVLSVAFSRDGRTLAAASADHAVYRWNVAAPKRALPLGQPLAGPGGAVLSLAFSPDGHTLAAGNIDGAVDLWHLPPTLLAGAGGNVNAAAFSPDGRLLAVGSQSGTVNLWSLAERERPAPHGKPLTGTTAAVDSLAFSPDGRLLAAGDGDGTVHLWDMSDEAGPTAIGTPLSNPGGRAMSLAFTPDGHTLAVAANGTSLTGVSLWNLSDPRKPISSGGITTDGTRSVFTVAFASDGHTLATGGDSSSSQIGLWRVRDSESVRLGQPLQQPAGSALWATFSPDGRTLAVGSSQGVVTLWNTADPDHPVPLASPLTTTGPVWAVAFSPDGRTLAATLHAATGALVRWDISDRTRPTPIGDPLTTSTGPLTVTAFSPDGRTLAATTDGGAVGLWSLDAEQVAAQVCATSGPLDDQQWAHLVASLPYTSTC
ncbi:WD40 repeat domain-containing protein [Kitasatospora sp. NPDC048538]|uniref:WD40 repeat domain-containing protein n=1 Tax=unclassified Kitasatospora TaxID=2633591 RepID=UPI0033F2B39F